jgi:hypothetical protein
MGNPLRQWEIRLDQLDDTEVSALIAFVEEQGSAPFAFTDPVTGNQAASCVIAGNQYEAVMKAEMNGQTTIRIEEIA